MKKGILLLISFVLGINLYAQDSAHIFTFGGIQNDVCNQIQPTYDKGFIMVGTTNSFGCGYNNIYAIKTDSAGNRLWSATYSANEIQEGFSVAATFDHGYAFLGFTDTKGANGYDVLLVRTDSAGNELWEKTYGGDNWDFGYSLQQLPDSGFIICGLTYSYGPGNGNVYVIRTDKNGDTIWTRALGGLGYNIGNSVCVVEDSLYAIMGNTTSFGLGDSNAYFILMDNKGIVKKDTTYGCTHSTEGNSIRETQDKGFIIFGATDSIQTGKPDEMLLKIDSAGHLQWVHIFNSSGRSIGHDALQAPDASYLAVSTSNAYGLGGYAMRIWSFDAGGLPLSGPSYGGNGDESGNSVALGLNGNAAFAGATDSPGYTEGLVDAYLVLLPSDTVTNILNYFTLPYKMYKDTCLCIPTGTLQVVTHPGVKIFPNPVNSSATILIQGTVGEHYMCNVYNENGGKIVLNIPLASANHAQFIGHFEKSNLAAGIYFYTILNQAGVIVNTGKIIVE